MKLANEILQQRCNIIPDTFGLEQKIIEHEKNIMNIHKLSDELSIQKLTNEPFLFEGQKMIWKENCRKYFATWR